MRRVSASTTSIAPLLGSLAYCEALYRERMAAFEAFYQDFFHQLVLNFGERFHNERLRARIQ